MTCYVFNLLKAHNSMRDRDMFIMLPSKGTCILWSIWVPISILPGGTGLNETLLWTAHTLSIMIRISSTCSSECLLSFEKMVLLQQLFQCSVRIGLSHIKCSAGDCSLAQNMTVVNWIISFGLNDNRGCCHMKSAILWCGSDASSPKVHTINSLIYVHLIVSLLWDNAMHTK